MSLHIGTSGWSYPTWKPAFFPEGLPSKRFLEFYATQLNAVELNATFRRMPAATASAGWIAAATPDFRFAAKAHQSITHFKRLKNAEEPLRFFLQSLEPLRQSGKLGAILLQVPPNLKADTALLESFVQLLPQAYQFAFEFRHETWFADAVYEILKKKNVALCWAGARRLSHLVCRRPIFSTIAFACRGSAKPSCKRSARRCGTRPKPERSMPSSNTKTNRRERSTL